MELDGIGDVKARSVYDWCRFTKSDAVKNLMIHILMEELEVGKPVQTTYLVNNDLESTSGKNKKAHELNIPILSEDAFVEKFGK